MGERRVIDASVEPVSVDSLARELGELGVTPSEVLLVHSSLSALGWVCGGAVAVVQALLHVLGPEGTVVMPAQSADLSEPSQWVSPPVPVEWQEAIRGSMPAFDVRLTPTRGMGAVAEVFRTWPGSLRSTHPTGSFTARGPRAAQIVSRQDLTDPFGEGSPLAQLYALSARVLLLGVGYDSCTALHLAERRAFGDQQACEYTGSPILLNDQRTWVEYSAPLVDDADFTKLGQTFEDNGPAVLKGRVGLATARLIPLVALVDFAKGWLAAHRSPDGASPPLA